MGIEAASPEEYISQLAEDRQRIIEEMRTVLKKNLPEGYVEIMQYGMISFVVPHELYPPGYHAKPEEPLPFISIASQKNHIALYHMGIYSDDELLAWFRDEYDRVSSVKLDMGKSCIRFKKPEHVPLELIGRLAKKMSPGQWIELYEKNLQQR